MQSLTWTSRSAGLRPCVVTAAAHRTSVRAALVAPVQRPEQSSANESITHLLHTSSQFIAALALSRTELSQEALQEWGHACTSAPHACEELLVQALSQAAHVATEQELLQFTSILDQAASIANSHVRADTAKPVPRTSSSVASTFTSEAPVTPIQRSPEATPALSSHTRHKQAAWQHPESLSASALAKCVYAFARIGHVPSPTWMESYLRASERVLQQHTASFSPALAPSSSTALEAQHHSDRRVDASPPQAASPSNPCAGNRQLASQHSVPGASPPASPHIPGSWQANVSHERGTSVQQQLHRPVWVPAHSASSTLHTPTHSTQPETMPAHPPTQPALHTASAAAADDRLNAAQFFMLAWGTARLYQLQRRSHAQLQADATATGPTSCSTNDKEQPTSRLGSVLAQLSVPDINRHAPAEQLWPAPSRAWVLALEQAATTFLTPAVQLATFTQPTAPHATPPATSTATGSTAASMHSRSHQQHTASRGHSSADARVLVVVPWLMAKLQLRPSGPWLHIWLCATHAVLPDMSSRDLAQLLWSLTQLDCPPPEQWMQTLVARCQTLAVEQQLPLQDLSQILWCLAKLRYDPGPAFASSALSPAALTAALSKVNVSASKGPHPLVPRSVATMLWALATLGQQLHPAVLHTQLLAVEPYLRQGVSDQDLAMILWSMGKLRYNPATHLRTGLLQAASHFLTPHSTLTPRSLPILAWALARLPWQLPPDLAPTILRAGACMAPQLSPRGVAMLLLYASKQPKQLRDKQCMAALLRATMIQPASTPGSAQQKVDATTPGSVRLEVDAGASGTPYSQDTQHAAGIPHHHRSVWAQCSCSSAAMALISLARCSIRPTAGWMRQFFSGTRETLAGASGRDLYLLVRALSRLAYRPPRAWATAVTRRAQQLWAVKRLTSPAYRVLVRRGYLPAPTGKQLRRRRRRQRQREQEQRRLRMAWALDAGLWRPWVPRQRAIQTPGSKSGLAVGAQTMAPQV